MFFSVCNSTSNANEEQKALFTGIKPWELKTMSLSDNAGNTLTFKRVMCVWTVGEENQPTNEAKVANLADSLIALNSSKIIGQGDTFFLPNRVDEKVYDLKVILRLGGKGQVVVFFGKGNESGSAFVRLQENNEVHFVKGIDLNEIVINDQAWKVES